MGRFPFLLAAVTILGVLLSLPSRAANKPAQGQAQKVWTNADLDQLHEQGLISILRLESIPPLVLGAPADAEPEPAQQDPAQKIWTNADLDQLHEQDLISILGPEPAPAPVSAESAVAAAELAPYERTKDPRWYTEQAAELRAELEETEAALHASEFNLAQAEERNTQPGIALDRGNIGITPQAGIEILEQRAREVQDRLDDLGDLARRSGIPPGVLRD